MLAKLQIFLKDNNLDILEYWVSEQSILYYIRVLQKKSGVFLMLKLKHFHIRVDEIALISENKFNKLIKFEKVDLTEGSENTPEGLLLYYDEILRCIPECRKNFVLQHSNYLMVQHDVIYQLKSTSPMIKYLHWAVDLEWFYENVTNLDFETNRWHQMIVQRMTTQYERFLCKQDHFLKRDQTYAMHKVWEYYLEKMRQYDKYKRLYLKIVCTETAIKTQYLEMENVHEMGTFDFNESLRKTHRKGLLRKKLQNLYTLRCESILELSEYWSELYHVMIEIIHFANELKIVLSRYNTLFVNIENFLV